MRKFNKKETLDFNEKDWYFEIQSGYSGWKNRVSGDWLYESHYIDLMANKNSYQSDFELIYDFIKESFNLYSKEHVTEYLDKIYF